jgi:hypothetical protein
MGKSYMKNYTVIIVMAAALAVAGPQGLSAQQVVTENVNVNANLTYTDVARIAEDIYAANQSKKFAYAKDRVLDWAADGDLSIVAARNFRNSIKAEHATKAAWYYSGETVAIVTGLGGLILATMSMSNNNHSGSFGLPPAWYAGVGLFGAGLAGSIILPCTLGIQVGGTKDAITMMNEIIASERQPESK